jgi:glycosyltransferase EpsE
MIDILNKPLISIIMGIYNCGSTLAEAIDSIIAQTYTNWELIMCDDGSLDNTYEVASKYVQKYPQKIKLIQHKKNQGLNITLNDCLKEANGKYIARMDGDDISLPERFQKEFEFLESNPQYAIVSTPMIYFDEKGDFRTGKGGYEPELSSFVLTTPFCHAPCMVRKDAYDAVGGYSECKDRLRVEDRDLWIRMYDKGYKGYNLSEPLYKMRDDRNAYKRRKFRYRINAAKIGIFAIKTFNLPKWYYIKCLRPIMVGLLPSAIYIFLHKNIKHSKNKK